MCHKHRQLLNEHRRLLKENRALRCLLYFQHDRDLAALLLQADQNDSLEDVLGFVIWALERQLLVAKGSRHDPAERPYCSPSIPF